MEDELSRRNVDTSKFPLGEISPACIRAAYAALSAASAALDRPASAATDDVQRARDAQVIQAATNDFLRAIPHRVPRGGMAALRLDSMEIIRKRRTSYRPSSRFSSGCNWTGRPRSKLFPRRPATS